MPYLKYTTDLDHMKYCSLFLSQTGYFLMPVDKARLKAFVAKALLPAGLNIAIILHVSRLCQYFVRKLSHV